MRRVLTEVLVVAALVAAWCGTSAVLKAQPAAPSAETLLDSHVKAIGGAQAFTTLNSRVVTARMDVPAAGISMAITVWAARPNKVRTLVESDVVGRIERGFDGTVGWEMNPMSGTVIFDGARLDDAARDANFDGLAAWRDWVVKAETQGTADVDGKPAWKVLVTPKRGSPQTYYFDQASSLVVKLEATARSSMGEMVVQTYFSARWPAARNW